MAGIDSLLRMAASEDADELRVATDEAPKVLRKGAPTRVTIPPTPDGMLRALLEGILTPERDSAISGGKKVELQYQEYTVTLQARPAGGVQAIFKKGGAPAAAGAAAAAAPTPAPPPAPVRAQPQTRSETNPAVLQSLLRRAVALGASDLHLFVGEPPAVRVDGQLRTLDEFPSVDVEALFPKRVPDVGSIDFSLTLPDLGSFRVNVYRAQQRLAAAVRILPRSAPRLAELNFPVSLDDLVDIPHGLIIVTGPTGSGKSATLAALAEEAVRRRRGVLITLEDPVEYPIRGEGGLVRQRQIGADVRDFPSGLRDALREDPDILLIGEMRDPESISLALTAAETGHLVLASLHSRSAASSIERIVDSYPAERAQQIRVQLADALRAVIAQRLLPRARGGGRVPAVEILRGNHTVGAMIREGKTAQLATVLQSSRKEGMLPLERCLADLVRANQVTRASATAVANDANALASYLKE